jgi:hypothetical protein
MQIEDKVFGTLEWRDGRWESPRIWEIWGKPVKVMIYPWPEKDTEDTEDMEDVEDVEDMEDDAEPTPQTFPVEAGRYLLANVVGINRYYLTKPTPQMFPVEAQRRLFTNILSTMKDRYYSLLTRELATYYKQERDEMLERFTQEQMPEFVLLEQDEDIWKIPFNEYDPSNNRGSDSYEHWGELCISGGSSDGSLVDEPLLFTVATHRLWDVEHGVTIFVGECGSVGFGTVYDWQVFHFSQECNFLSLTLEEQMRSELNHSNPFIGKAYDEWKTLTKRLCGEAYSEVFEAIRLYLDENGKYSDPNNSTRDFQLQNFQKFRDSYASYHAIITKIAVDVHVNLSRQVVGPDFPVPPIPPLQSDEQIWQLIDGRALFFPLSLQSPMAEWLPSNTTLEICLDFNNFWRKCHGRGNGIKIFVLADGTFAATMYGESTPMWRYSNTGERL